MFELPQPTKCIEWSQLGTGEHACTLLRHTVDINALPCTAICVAGCVATTETTSTEITQLALPEKLLPSKDEVPHMYIVTVYNIRILIPYKTHWAKRDFRLINGALSRTPITSLKHLLSTE